LATTNLQYFSGYRPTQSFAGVDDQRQSGHPDVLREVSISLRTYDVSPDGRRFLVIKDAPGENASASPPQVIVVQNWVEEWKRLGRR